MAKKIDVKSLSTGITFDRDNFMLVLKIFHYMRWKLRHNPDYKKTDLIFQFGKHKTVVEEIWKCYHELKIDIPYEIYKRVFES